MFKSQCYVRATWFALLAAAFVLGGCGGNGETQPGDDPGNSNMNVEFVLPAEGSEVGSNAAPVVPVVDETLHTKTIEHCSIIREFSALEIVY